MRALEKAERLYAYAQSQGAKLDTFQLVLTDAEALEALDWFKTQMVEDAAFEFDLAIAHRTGNPWDMMHHFQLMGFAVVPVQDLN